ncbi:MAG: tetratricopeptide repeat protein [Deltaproteobacteria bacterium]|nr:tetratricopeptide repeat protein [Deltaproteobacteria bacterium]MCL5277064.1 tetratricopeptide repeat protein [Deltaproteobacteria bacterium]
MVCKNFKPILISLFVIFATSCAGKNPEDVKQAGLSYDVGVMLLNRGNYPGAIQQLTSAQRLNPDDPYTANALGLAYYGVGMKPEAERSYKKAIGLKKDYSDAYSNLGVLYLSESKWDLAIDAFHSALSNPLYMSPQITWANMGWAYYQMDKLDQAERAYRSALELLPDMPLAHNDLGLVYLRENRLNEAETEFKTAIYYFKGYTQAYLNLGIVYMRRKNYTEAKKQFETVLTMAPNSPIAADARNYIRLLR